MRVTDRGREDVEKLASSLRGTGLRLNSLWESGKKRATQTSEILASALLSPQGTVSRKPGIGPKDPVGPVAEEVAGISSDHMIVGHLPFLSRLVTFLILGEEGPDLVSFQQGGAVCLNREEAGNWSVQWMVVPSIL